MSSNAISGIGDYLDFGMGDAVIQKAIDEALDNNVRKWSYVDRILFNWQKANIKTIDDLTRYKADKPKPKDGGIVWNEALFEE